MTFAVGSRQKEPNTAIRDDVHFFSIFYVCTKNKGKCFLDAPCGRIEKTLPKGSSIEAKRAIVPPPLFSHDVELRFRGEHGVREASYDNDTELLSS